VHGKVAVSVALFVSSRHTAMHIALDSAFERLKLEEDPSFYPKRGFEHTRGSET
jgi:hypothetical protein